ncbi:hypothetical protein L3N51_01919 [Metallosphaera sp. J1]|uniref:VapB-type antitoxin n=1 Tax=Metallosphaera javensis (ex Hofmann et al. 2022) TaxID=99938 RepID=UPI001EDF8FB5|nr:VapB-type antitoxin [Metallosphaera javensis (ex Hofmann et al. 2022)]MCG3109624.1 hypothetical protein [Metallosphaera javensis (ex Hofmann et al. 2022)]
MGHTTISVREDTKRKLELIKRKLEISEGRTLNWDDFFRELLRGMDSEKESIALNDDEARILLELTREGRKSWRARNVWTRTH